MKNLIMEIGGRFAQQGKAKGYLVAWSTRVKAELWPRRDRVE